MFRHHKAGMILAIGGLVAMALCAGRVGGAPSPSRRNPFTADSQSLGIGKKLFAAHCADCHGASGKGDGKNAHDLEKEVPDLTNPRVADMSDAKLFEWVTQGKKPMPGFEKDLAEQERWHVINYVRSLSKTP